MGQSTTATIRLIHILVAKNSKIKYDAFAELLTMDDLSSINKIFGIEDGDDTESDAEKNVGKKE